MVCEVDCPRERVQFDPASAGVVEDDETICRAAFDPDDYNTKGVKNNFVTLGKLARGELSVYRASEKSNFTIEQAAQQIKETNVGRNLKEIYVSTANQIRGLRLEWLPGRLFCIIDNPFIDAAGNTHRAHALITLCQSVMDLQLCDEDMQSVRDHLSLLLKEVVGWPPAVSQAAGMADA